MAAGAMLTVGAQLFTGRTGFGETAGEVLVSKGKLRGKAKVICGL